MADTSIYCCIVGCSELRKILVAVDEEDGRNYYSFCDKHRDLEKYIKGEENGRK